MLNGTFGRDLESRKVTLIQKMIFSDVYHVLLV